ncbi:hypothetical protein M0802_009583 [Mischocyttarus mexicanus]|nr:hypothetical protein M0802_009583 [Mischocyttarus mexicanus]
MEINKRLELIEETFLELTEDLLKYGVTINDLKMTIGMTDNIKINNNSNLYYFRKASVVLLISIIYGLFFMDTYFDVIKKNLYETRCIVPNNYLIWEFTRPISNCDYCRNINMPIILSNVTKKDFEPYAYSSKPIIIKNATSHWPASKIFSFEFFQNLYEHIDGTYESIEEESQFLQFNSNFNNLREVFAMSKERAMNEEGEEPWYIGWKNCHPEILDVMKKFYDVPEFLPDDAEVPQINYIFMGYKQGAYMHLDYISRLMWQGQLIGSKKWIVAPSLECNHICKPFNFSVDTGDIILLDTRIWYHSTYTENGKFSLTISSEYG